MTEIIYSFKASGGGCRVSGRVCAVNMIDATNQALKIIEGYTNMNVSVSQLANQSLALKKWKAEGNKNG